MIHSEMTQLQSNASLVGIKISLQPKPFNQTWAQTSGFYGGIASAV